MKVSNGFCQRCFRGPVATFYSVRTWLADAHDSIGIFESHGDVGDSPKKGSASYDAVNREYRITGGGANMWGNIGRVSFCLEANIRISPSPLMSASSAKAWKSIARRVLVVRASLDPKCPPMLMLLSTETVDRAPVSADPRG